MSSNNTYQNVSALKNTDNYETGRETSSTSCYRTANNKHFNAPPRMADGRNFTDYRDSYVVNNLVINDNKNNVSNSYDYRLFLQQNANHIMERNWEQAYLKNGVFNCTQPYEQGTMLPEQIVQSCDSHRCDFKENYAEGIGLGRASARNDQQNMCVSPLTGPEVVLQNNQCAPAAELNNYYGNKAYPNVQRQAVPGGGQMLNGGDPNVNRQ
jgi:hypothetical protein